MHDGFDFDAYLTSQAAKLTGYCAAVTGPADAEDAAQEAFLRLWQNLGRIPNEAAANAFLYKTAARVSIDLVRRRRRFREPDPAPPADDSLSSRMSSALAALRPEDRAVVWLRVVEECGYDEIARRLGKKETWARKRYSLARRKLETILAERPKGDSPCTNTTVN